jgi:hypothetical protein
MRPLKSEEIYGNWATLLLPINPNDSIDYLRLEEEIDKLIAMQVNGIYSNGTAGEFYNQTEAEFDSIHQLLADKCNVSGMPFQIGGSHMSPVISLERIKRSVAFQPSAFQVILPDWYSPTMEEIIAFLEKIAEAAHPVGLVLYNPGHAKRKLSPQEWGIVRSRIAALVGCKVAGGDESWYRAMQQHVPGFSVFVPGHTLATGFKMGAELKARPLFFYLPLYEVRWGSTPCAIVREGDWKLIEFFGDWFDPDGRYLPGHRLELYNLRHDLGETANRASEQPKRAAALRATLHAWMKSVPAQIPGSNPRFEERRQLLEVK